MFSRILDLVPFVALTKRKQASRNLIKEVSAGEITSSRLDGLGVSRITVRTSSDEIVEVSWYSTGDVYDIALDGKPCPLTKRLAQPIAKAAIRRSKKIESVLLDEMLGRSDA